MRVHVFQHTALMRIHECGANNNLAQKHNMIQMTYG